MRVWKDITVEERSFEENPHATRKFKSMVSIPLLVGDHAVGVFNVVTEQVDAFDVADINYLTSLGAVIQTAVGVAVKDAKGTQNKQPQRVRGQRPARQDKALARVAKPRLLQKIPPRDAPEGGIGSGGSPEENGGSDD
jgi:transcriptional regulator with GAF, ATPase, and Fis domain